MNDVHVIRKPIVTEKSTFAMNELNQYTFEVAPEATKPQIREAVERLYGVKVESVRTITRRGEIRRSKSGWHPPKFTKRAVVRLREGDAIELF